MANITNADIMAKLMDIATDQALVKVDVAAVREQATKTNGRVNTIEQWMNGIQAIDRYKRENPEPAQIAHADQVIVQKKWYDSKELVKAAGIIAAAIGAIATFYISTGVGQ